MELIYNFIKSRNAQLTSRLLDAGIEADKTEEFLQQASGNISNILSIVGIDNMLVSFVSGDIHGFMKHLDLKQMSAELNMREEQVYAGMHAIWPVISGLVDNEDTSALHEASSLYSNLTSH